LTDEERRKIAWYSRQIGAWDWDKLANWPADELMEWGADTDLLTDWRRDVAALGTMIESQGPLPDEWTEYDESAADDVEWNECPECGHKWPK
jgi:hypothetical protein